MGQQWGALRIIDPEFLFGSNTVFRREAVEAAGFYCPRYTTNREDYALSVQLKKNGHTLVYDPAAIAYHMRRDTIGSLLRTHWRWSFFGTQGMRHPDSVYNLACRFYDRGLGLGRLFFADLARGHYGLAALDLVMQLHHSCADIQYYCCRRQSHE
jgi:GT2 family glycosyltransferase